MIKAVLFDLDGTLLPMNEEVFTNTYFGLLVKKLMPFGYKKEELISAVWAGTKAMIKNQGNGTNCDVFWKVFGEIFGKEKIEDKKIFDDFYLNEFKLTRSVCGENPKAKLAVQFAKSCGLKTILASNPLFPKSGMVTRMGFVNLKESDFDYISSYENSHYSKPNPIYFKEILDNNGLAPDEVILFGNSEVEDIEPAMSLGIRAVLVVNDDIDAVKPEYETVKHRDILNFLQNIKTIK